MRFIDLRSDTATQPTPGMREAISRAEVGDEQKREDPTVNELEQRVAALVGQEEAVFLPTATMANQIALRLLSEPGDELLADAWSHLFINELGGPAVHSGLVMRPLDVVRRSLLGRAGARGGLGPPGHAPPDHAPRLDREHEQLLGRTHLAGRRDRRRRARSAASSTFGSTSTAPG